MIKKKILAWVLLVAMCISIVPSPAYASILNGGAGGDVLTGSGPGHEDWTNPPNLNGMWGYRVEVHYAEIMGETTDENGVSTPIYNWEDSIKVGATRYIKENEFGNKNLTPSTWGNTGAFDLMRGKQTWSKSKTTFNNLTKKGLYIMYTDLTKGTTGYTQADIDAESERLYEAFKDRGTVEGDTAGNIAVQDFVDRIYNMETTGGDKKMTVDRMALPFPEEYRYNTENTEFVRSYFLNPTILKMISESTNREDELAAGETAYTWDAEDFVLGTLRDSTGNVISEQGQYKLIVEPCAFRMFDGVFGVRTYTDSVSQKVEQLGDSYGGRDNPMRLGTAWDTQTGSMRLTEPDSVLNVESISGKTIDQKWESARNELNSEYGKWVLTSPSLNSYPSNPQPQVVKTYIKVKSINADGTFNIEDAEVETVIENATFSQTDERGNILNVPDFSTKETVQLTDKYGNKMAGTAFLNDSITVPQSFSLTDEITWESGLTPTINGETLEPSGQNIVTYGYNRILRTEGQLESYDVSRLRSRIVLE